MNICLLIKLLCELAGWKDFLYLSLSINWDRMQLWKLLEYPSLITGLKFQRWLQKKEIPWRQHLLSPCNMDTSYTPIFVLKNVGKQNKNEKIQNKGRQS